MNKLRYGLAALALAGSLVINGCGGNAGVQPGLVQNFGQATLHQFAYVATTAGINAFNVAANGTVTANAAGTVAKVNVTGLSVAPNGTFLIATIDTGTAATSGLQVFLINPVNGALVAGTLVPATGGAGQPASPPSGPNAIDANSAAGAFLDDAGNVEGFVINAAGASVTVSATSQPQDGGGNANSFAIATAGGNDTIILGNNSGQSPNSFPLNAATGAVGTEVAANLGTIAGTPASVAPSVVGAQGAQGIYVAQSNADPTTTTNAQPFAVDAASDLTGGTSTQMAGTETVAFVSVQVFNVAGTPTMVATSSAAVGVGNTFLGSLLQAGTLDTADATAAGTPQATAVATPPAGSGAATTVVVVSNNAGTLTLTPFTTTGANLTAVGGGGVATVTGVTAAASTNNGNINENVAGTASFFF